MAIAHDSTTTGAGVDGNTNYTFSHTCTGSDLMLMVCVTTNTTTDPSGITYNGVAMTKGATKTQSRNGSIWYLANPATGANTVSVTYAAAFTLAMGSATSYTGCSGSIGATGTNGAASGTTISVAITTTVANSYLVGAVECNNNQTFSSSGGSTIRANQNGGVDTISQGCVDLSTPTVQSNTLACTFPSSGDWLIAAIEILPVAVVASISVTHNLSLLGVGQ